MSPGSLCGRVLGFAARRVAANWHLARLLALRALMLLKIMYLLLQPWVQDGSTCQCTHVLEYGRGTARSPTSTGAQAGARSMKEPLQSMPSSKPAGGAVFWPPPLLAIARWLGGVAHAIAGCTRSAQQFTATSCFVPADQSFWGSGPRSVSGLCRPTELQKSKGCLYSSSLLVRYVPTML